MDTALSLVISPGESSGTVVAREGQDAPQHVPTDALMPPTKQPNSPSDGEALESHEVIELQTFIERKAWIEEKIKFLEKLPPIEVFVGIEALETSAEDIPGLPSREQLKQWLAEHEIIEKETEIFDTGELKKLRKTTRAATQRNLSPEDTDLIELTLTTIYELDKLLHLLRNRSENLDLLGVRLTWEENRIASWVARRQLIADLKSFLATRARWSPSVYENASASPPVASPYNPTVRRRGSAASLASVASELALSSPGFSRTARFTQAELLSRDSAQFAGRVTALRHGSIATAGKILDKLIDNSRKPVPEILLDEQDKLEEKGIAQLEHIGKFVMNVVMQWRKADETYVETIKDQTAANTLLSDIDAASAQHPTSRLSASFISRADTLRKRLSIRGDPTLRGSIFPCPTHPLFPEQAPFNATLVQSLSTEITSALAILKTAEAAAAEYRGSYEAVKTFETMTQSANDLTSQYQDILQRLQFGVHADDGDGSPPNLHSEACLDPTAHSVFLALMPTDIHQLDTLNAATTKALKAFPAALLRLNVDGVDRDFKQEGVVAMDMLKDHQEKAGRLRSELSARIDRLREARRLKSIMEDRTRRVQAVVREVDASMLKSRWRQTTSQTGAPPTPESPPTIPLPSLPVDVDLQRQVEELTSSLSQDIAKPLHTLSLTLEVELAASLQKSSRDLEELLAHARSGLGLLASIKAQTAMMETIRDEANLWRVEIEDLKVQYDATAESYLEDQIDAVAFSSTQAKLLESSDKLRTEVGVFIDAIPKRIQFLARSTETSHTVLADGHTSPTLPLNLRSLDDAVRHDCNDFSIRLNGDLRGLEQKAHHLQLAKMAKDVDAAISVSLTDITDASQKLASLKSVQQNIGQEEDVHTALTSLLGQIDELSSSSRQRFSRALSPARDLLRSMSLAPGVNDPAVHEVLFLARKRRLSDAELRLKGWDEQVQAFRTTVADAQVVEASRLEAERLAEEERVKAEQERLAAEAVERARLEEEEKERLRALEAKKAEEERLEAERARLEAEEAERARLEKERLLREEEERRLEEDRVAAENAKRLKEQQEREALEQERLAMELKLRHAEEERARLEKERLMREENERRHEEERVAAEEVKRLSEQQDREALERERQEMKLKLEHAEEERARLERERLIQAEKERTLEEERLAAEVAKRLDERKERDDFDQQRRDMQLKLLHAEQELAAERQSQADRLASDLQAKLQAAAQEPPTSLLAFPDSTQDVFGLKRDAGNVHQPKSQEVIDLQVRILNLRKRLRSLSLTSISRPSSSSSSLPTEEELEGINENFVSICEDVAQLPSSIDDQSAQVELDSLKHDVDVSVDLMDRIRMLVTLTQAIVACDASLSDLLEHVDSYPALPAGALSSSYRPLGKASAEEQLKGRLAFTKVAMDSLQTAFLAVSDDRRAIEEHQRILQTWDELKEMATDRMSGRKSRPNSVISSVSSSGRSSRISSIAAALKPPARKSGSYANLSVSSKSRGGLAVPATSRRAISGSTERSSSRMSTTSTRSTSGPLGLFGSTFASRQRTTSLTPQITPTRRTSGAPIQARTQTPTLRRGAASPSISEISSVSNMASSRHSTSASSWSRAPRTSFTTSPRSPSRKPAVPRKTYVANPKSKLDVAVGDVVNNLPVGINIEGVSGSWKDQSGKYWIGDQDAKLCFCRILRSQTVMVRVGGGWQELSKFIRGHFADSFRLLPDSPQVGTREERWISAATLMEEDVAETPPHPPRTPEPKSPYLPSFSISTPSHGHSPKSIKSSPSSSKGSPLTPLQFLRRAEPEIPFLAPSSPSKPPISRPRLSATPVRGSVWRP